MVFKASPAPGDGVLAEVTYARHDKHTVKNHHTMFSTALLRPSHKRFLLGNPTRACLMALCLTVRSEPANPTPQGQALKHQPTLELRLGPHRIAAEIAVTSEALLTGLMWRRSLAPDAGMLFVFPPHIRRCMIMRHTYIPLSVAFLDAHRKIVQINEMKPLTEQEHCASPKAEYALEMNRGWFARKSIRPGTALTGLEQVRSLPWVAGSQVPTSAPRGVSKL